MIFRCDGCGDEMLVHSDADPWDCLLCEGTMRERESGKISYDGVSEVLEG